MKLNQEQINEILENSIPSIAEGLSKDLSDSISRQISYESGELVGEFVRNWVKENILPEVEKNLIESKDGLIRVGIELGDQSVKLVTENMVKALSENLSSTYNRKKMFEGMFL